MRWNVYLVFTSSPTSSSDEFPHKQAFHADFTEPRETTTKGTDGLVRASLIHAVELSNPTHAWIMLVFGESGIIPC